MADEECFSCGVDDFGCECVDLVEGLDAFDLGQAAQRIPTSTPTWLHEAGEAHLRLTPLNIDALCEFTVAGRWVLDIVILDELISRARAEVGPDRARELLAEAVAHSVKLRYDIDIYMGGGRGRPQAL